MPNFRERPSNQSLDIEKAKNILGPENVHGSEDLETEFGIKIDPKDVPPMPYSAEELEEQLKKLQEK